VPRSYLYFQSVVTIVSVTVAAYLVGARGAELLLASLVGFFPVAMLVSFVTRRVVPPKLRFSDNYSAQLRFPDNHEG
jgi:hypothetical protein